jgi:hypothetical protein
MYEFDYISALRVGDDEGIAKHLSEQTGFDYDSAIKAGGDPEGIINYLYESKQVGMPAEPEPPPKDYGILGDFVQGVAGAAKGVAGGMRATDFDPTQEQGIIAKSGKYLSDVIDTAEQKYDILKPVSRPEEGRLMQGVRSTAQSVPASLLPLGGAAAGALAGSVLGPVGTVAGGVIGGVGTLFGTFFGGTYQNTYDDAAKELKAKGVPDDKIPDLAHNHALTSAKYEFGTELASDAISAAFFGLLGKNVVKEGLKKTVRGLMSPGGAKEFAKAYAKSVPFEAGSEMLAGYGQAKSAQETGLDTPEPTEAMKQAIIPAVLMPLFFGAGAHGMQAYEAKQTYNDLNSDNDETRIKAVQKVAGRLDEEERPVWLKAGYDFIKNKQEIPLSKPIVDFATQQDINKGSADAATLNNLKIALESGKVTPDQISELKKDPANTRLVPGMDKIISDYQAKSASTVSPTIAKAKTATEAMDAFEKDITGILSANISKESEQFGDFLYDEQVGQFEKNLASANAEIQSYPLPEIKPELTPVGQEVIDRQANKIPRFADRVIAGENAYDIAKSEKLTAKEFKELVYAVKAKKTTEQPTHTMPDGTTMDGPIHEGAVPGSERAKQATEPLPAKADTKKSPTVDVENIKNLTNDELINNKAARDILFVQNKADDMIKDLDGTFRSGMNEQEKAESINWLKRVEAKLTSKQKESVLNLQTAKADTGTQEGVESLETEAKKYKSADEFIKSQPILYHGTNNKNVAELKSGKPRNAPGNLEGVYLTNDKRLADAYGENTVEAHSYLKNPLMENPFEYYAKKHNIAPVGFGSSKEAFEKYKQVNPVNVRAFLESEGFDGAVYDTYEGHQVVAFDPESVKTKTQLTDIWNKANTPQDSLKPENQGMGEQAQTKAEQVEKFNTQLSKATKLHKASYGIKPQSSLQRLLEAKQILDEIGFPKEQELYTENERLITNYKEQLGIEPKITGKKLKERYISESMKGDTVQIGGMGMPQKRVKSDFEIEAGKLYEGKTTKDLMEKKYNLYIGKGKNKRIVKTVEEINKLNSTNFTEETWKVELEKFSKQASDLIDKAFDDYAAKLNQATTPQDSLKQENQGMGEQDVPEIGTGEKAKQVSKYPMATKDKWYGDSDYEQRGGKIVNVSPDEYLESAKPLKMDDETRENVDLLKEHILSGKELDPLALYGTDKTSVKNSDGRHRAIAAKELGMKQVPVIDFTDTLGKPKTPPAEPQLPADRVIKEPWEMERKEYVKDIRTKNDKEIKSIQAEAKEWMTLKKEVK